MITKHLRIGVIGPVLSFSGTSTHTKRISQGISLNREIFSCLITYIEPNSSIPIIHAPKIGIHSQNEIHQEIDLRKVLDAETKEYAPNLENKARQEISVPVYVFDKPMKPENFASFAQFIASVAKKENLNVLHPQIKPFVLFSSHLAKEELEKSGKSVHIIGTWHSNFGWIRDAKYHLALAFMGSKSLSSVIPVSMNVKEDLRSILKLDENRLLPIIPPGGIDYELLQKDRTSLLLELRRKYSIGERYIVFLGRLLYNKGVDLLLEAYSHLSSSKTPSLVILGSGPFRETFIEKAKNLGLEVITNDSKHDLEDQKIIGDYPKVFFLSGLSDEEVYAFLQGAILYSLPSRWESFSISTLEAMAAGAPVVCTKVGGLAYWVGGAAYMVPKDDVFALQKAIETLLEDDSLREELRRKGKKKAKTYDWRELARKTIQAIEEGTKLITTHFENPCVNNLSFDPNTGIIRLTRKMDKCETIPNQMKISQEALFFPSETLEKGTYYEIIQE